MPRFGQYKRAQFVPVHSWEAYQVQRGLVGSREVHSKGRCDDSVQASTIAVGKSIEGGVNAVRGGAIDKHYSHEACGGLSRS